MKIDNRILLPFVMPFVLLGLFRVVWFVAGAAWTQPEVAAAFSLTIGSLLGGVFAGVLHEDGVTIGHITLWRSKGGDE